MGARDGQRRDPEAAAATAPTPEFPARAIYRALLVRGLEPGEAANLTAWLGGLPCVGLHWTIGEVGELIRRRSALRQGPPHRADRPTPAMVRRLS